MRVCVLRVTVHARIVSLSSSLPPSRVSFFLGLDHSPCRARGNASGGARVINPRVTSTRGSPDPPGNPVTARGAKRFRSIDRSIDQSLPLREISRRDAREATLSCRRRLSNASRKFSRAVRPRVGVHLRVRVRSSHVHTYTRPSCNGALGRSLNVDTLIESAR